MSKIFRVLLQGIAVFATVCSGFSADDIESSPPSGHLKVRVWEPTGLKSAGHVSVQTPKGNYISLWPRPYVPRLLQINGPAVLTESYEVDYFLQGKPPEFVKNVRASEVENVDLLFDFLSTNKNKIATYKGRTIGSELTGINWYAPGETGEKQTGKISCHCASLALACLSMSGADGLNYGQILSFDAAKREMRRTVLEIREKLTKEGKFTGLILSLIDPHGDFSTIPYVLLPKYIKNLVEEEPVPTVPVGSSWRCSIL